MILGAAIYHLSSTSCCRAAFFAVTRKPTYTPSSQRIAFSSLFSNDINVPSSKIVTSSYITTPFFHRRKLLQLYGTTSKGSNSNDNGSNEKSEEATFEPTWTYTPYKPPPPPRRKNNRNNRPNGQQQRNFSSRRNDDNWVVPNKVSIPEDQLEMSFERSGGAGGQNVNKVSFYLLCEISCL